MTTADIFVLTDSDGRLLPPAIQATVLAKYSRSAEGARDIVKQVTAEGADRFHDKNTIGYGHSSVAELATIPICFEGVSIIASKFIEGYQRAGYSEKSTRYQKFSASSWVRPNGSPRAATAAASLYEAYDAIYPRLLERVAGIMGKPIDDRAVKARTFDNVRYLLPAGTGTMVGGVYNLRDARYLIQDALGHDNPEIKAIGEAALRAVYEHCPTLVKNAEPDSFEPQIESIGPLSWKYDPENPNWYVDWWHHANLTGPTGPADWLVEAHDDFRRAVKNLYGMAWDEFSAHMDKRGRRGVPKVFRTVRVAFDVMVDFGAYRDLQRHRRCEQYAELLTGDCSYVVPDDILGTDLEREYRDAMDDVVDDRQIWRADCGIHGGQYVLPLGCLHRAAYVEDLAQVYYVGELRTQPQGHISYRRAAWEKVQLAKSIYPEAMQWCRAIEPTSIGAHT